MVVAVAVAVEVAVVVAVVVATVVVAVAAAVAIGGGVSTTRRYLLVNGDVVVFHPENGDNGALVRLE